MLVKVGPETRNNSRNRMLRAAPYLTVYVGVIVEQLGLPSPGSNGIVSKNKLEKSLLAAKPAFNRQLSGKLREAFDTAVSHTARKRHPGDILTESLDYLAVILKHPGVKKCFSRDFLQLLANFSANVRAALIPEDIILSFKETKHFQITNKLAKAAQGLLGVYEKCAEVDSAIDVLVRHAYNLPRETEGDGIMDIAFNCLVRFNDQKSVDWNNVHHWAAPLLFAILFRDRVRGSSIEGLRKLKIADPTNAPRTMQLPPLPGTAVESYLFSEETAYGVAESFQLLHFEPSEIASKEQLVRIRKLIDCLHILCRECESTVLSQMQPYD